MELKIRNGDYVLDGKGGVERLGGSEELIQRTLYKLTARRESFPFIPTLGSMLYALGSAGARQRASAAEQAVREALAGEASLTVDGVELTDAGDGLYTLRVKLTQDSRKLEVALTIQ